MTMPNTTSYKFGRIVLVRFPFTNQHGSKQRPVITIVCGRPCPIDGSKDDKAKIR